MNSRSKPFCLPVIALGVILSLTGCSLLNQSGKNEKINKRKEAFELKQKNYKALKEGLRTRTIPKGTPGSDIRARYGEPDDLFSSGSPSSNIAVWTYDNPGTEKGAEWGHIRLYFDNSELIDWTF